MIEVLLPTQLPAGSVYVEPTEKPSTGSNCTLVSGSYWALDNDHPLFEGLHHIFLTALSTDKEVRLERDLSNSSCVILNASLS